MIIGSGGGGIDVGERQYQDFFQNNGQHVTPYAIAVGICGMVSSEISIALGLRGISHVLSTGCTSSTDALGYAAMLLRQGECDVLLSGGTDGCVLPGMIFGFSRMRAVSTHYNDRPPRRRGRSIAAATASCSARAPGCWRSSSRIARAPAARRSTRPSTATPRPATPIIACRWIRMASRSSGACTRRSRSRAAPPEEIGYINYHGTSTQLNDAIESRCTRLAFGALADRIPGSSTKSMIGHPQGASGAAGVVATALALSRGFLPPTINLTDPDPAVRSRFHSQPGPRGVAGGRALQLPRVRIEEQRAGARPIRWMTS